MASPAEPGSEACEARYRTLFESAEVGIVWADAASRYRDVNPAACRMFGYTREEFLGLHAADLVAPREADRVDAALDEITGRPGHRREWRLRRKDGSEFDADVAANPLPDGTLLGIIRDLSALRQREQEVARLSALYAALSQINHAIVRVPAPEELFRAVCRALVDHGGFSVAWVGWHDPETQRLMPIATAGDEPGDLHAVAIYADERPEGRGPSGRAFRTGQPQVINDLLADAQMAPWRPVLERRGLRASATFPIREGGVVGGVLGVYDSRPHAFHDREVALLAETATDVAFGLDNFARDAARRRAEAAERSERLFSAAMIDSMPGVLYFYDASGRFLRWNRNFEVVSGYGPDEVREMHPRDFFADEDRGRVEARIAEVFASGESSVEATLTTRSGARIPYYFTGRRVVYEGRPCLVGVGIDISDRRLAETRQAISERKYRELVELANSIILRWDASGRITFLNEFGQRFFGYAHDEIVGRLVTDTIVPPTDSGGRELGPLIDRLRAAPEAYSDHVNENVRRSGERVWVAWANRVVRDDAGRVVEILSIGTDVTERRRAEAQLRESQAHLVEAQRIARVGSWELHLPTGRYTWSDQVHELFGVDRATFDGTTDAFLAAVHPDDRERLRAALRAARDGGAALDVEHRIVAPNGDEKVVRARASLARDEAGRPVRLSGTVQDITDRVRMEQERDRRHRAEAADRVKSAFLATMSHELRTPLNSIIGFTGILLQGLPGPLNAEQRTQLDMVRGSARHLLALVNDVLDISKIEAGQLEVARERFDPAASIARVVASIGPQADAKGLGLAVHVDPALGTALGDARRFEQILLNLLSNAIKFTERGGVSLTATLIEPAASTGEPALFVAIADTGIGIRAEHLGSLFQPFQQIDTGLSRTHEGTGLGLAICARLAALMGGTIAADSTWGRGSTFSVTLPLPAWSRR